LILTVVVSDGSASDDATITININDVVEIGNTAPVSMDVSVTTDEDTSVDITLLATDDDGDTLTYSLVTVTTNGTVSLSGSTATYTPTIDYNGSDSFTYNANDGTDDSNTATVTITITPVDDPLGIEYTSFIDKIYPNPTDNNLIIILKDNSKVEKVEFFDFSGKVIIPNKVVKTQNRLDINVSNIIEGIYLLHIITDKEVNKVKVVIER